MKNKKYISLWFFYFLLILSFIIINLIYKDPILDGKDIFVIIAMGIITLITTKNVKN